MTADGCERPVISPACLVNYVPLRRRAPLDRVERQTLPAAAGPLALPPPLARPRADGNSGGGSGVGEDPGHGGARRAPPESGAVNPHNSLTAASAWMHLTATQTLTVHSHPS